MLGADIYLVAMAGTHKTTGPAVDLDGSAYDGFQTLAAAGAANGDDYYVTIRDASNNTLVWQATYSTTGPKLTRVTEIDAIGTIADATAVSVYVWARTLVTGDEEVISIAASDETTDLTTGTAKATFRMPFAFTLSDVRASVTTAPTGSTLTVDINEGGTTILSTKLTIDATKETSETAATPAVISDTALADDAEITIDIDSIGSSTAGRGLKIYLIGSRT